MKSIRMRLQTEIPDGMNPCDKTIAILDTMEYKGFSIWEGDDGPEDYKTISDLVEIAGNVGYRVIRLNTFGVTQMDRTTLSSGRFLLLDDS